MMIVFPMAQEKVKSSTVTCEKKAPPSLITGFQKMCTPIEVLRAVSRTGKGVAKRKICVGCDKRGGLMEIWVKKLVYP